jgi:hypothetical protein
LPGSGGTKIGSLEKTTLRSLSGFCVSSVQQKESNIFNNLYRGSPHSPNRDTKQLRAARHPMSRWMSLIFLTWPILAKVDILSGFVKVHLGP